jgi:uncharacterized lipoprotein YddW (UPF0748 family)
MNPVDGASGRDTLASMIGSTKSQSFLRGLTIVTLLALHCPSGSAQDSPASQTQVEARGVWLHPESQFSADPEKGRQQVREFVRRFAQANFNLILPWIRSVYIAGLADESYRKTVPISGWNALGELVKAAHESNIQVQVWYSFTGYRGPESPEFNQKLGGNPAWAAHRITELVPDKTTGKVSPPRMLTICPLHPEGRRWQLRQLEALLDRHPTIDGIHIEEPGYDSLGNCVCDLCLKLFKNTYGFPATNAVDGAEATDLKCLGTTAFMRQLGDMLKKRNPKLMLSANGWCDWRGDRVLGRDWGHWARMGWLDYFVPQIYTVNLNDFSSYLQITCRDLKPGCPVLAGIGVTWSGGTNTLETVLKQIETSRRLSADGVVLFAGGAISDAHLAALKAGPFRGTARLPGKR